MLSLRLCKWFFKSLTRTLSEYLSYVETTCLLLGFFVLFLMSEETIHVNWRAQEARDVEELVKDFGGVW